jgi:hypothetical protein
MGNVQRHIQRMTRKIINRTAIPIHTTPHTRQVSKSNYRMCVITIYCIPWRMASSGMLRCVAVVRTGISEELTRATRRNISEDTNLHIHRRENLKSYILHYLYSGKRWSAACCYDNQTWSNDSDISPTCYSYMQNIYLHNDNVVFLLEHDNILQHFMETNRGQYFTVLWYTYLCSMAVMTCSSLLIKRNTC